jgi:general secretion pathway protein G
MIDRIRTLYLARKNGEKSEKGFTLIELLIVIVVLGILAGIVVFAMSNMTSQSAVSACKADAKSVEVATEGYRAQTGAFPTNVNALVPTYLRQAPNSTHYSITVDNTGAVTVTPSNGQPAGNFDTNNGAVCSTVS